MKSLMITNVIVVIVVFFCVFPLRASSDPKDEVDSLLDAGMATHELEELFRLANKIDSISASTRSAITHIKAQILFAKYYFAKFNIDSADHAFLNCDKIISADAGLQKTVAYSKMLMVMSSGYYQMGKTDAALKFRIKALKIAREINSIEQEMAVLRSVAVIENSRGHAEEALFYFLEYFTLRERTKQPLTETEAAKDYLSLANIYNAIKQYDNAKKYIVKALAIQLKSNNQKQQSFIYNSLGVVYRGLAQYDSAFLCFEKGKELALRNNQRLVVFNSRSNIAITHFHMGNYSRAILLLDSMLEEGADLPLLARVNPMQCRASSYYELGDQERALSAARTVYNISVDLKLKMLTLGSVSLLAKIYRDRKMYDSAAFYFQLELKYKDSLANYVIQDKFMQVQSKLQNLEKQKEIESLELERAVQRAQNKLLVLALIFAVITAGMAGTVIYLRYDNNKKKQRLVRYELQTELEKSRAELEQQAVRMIHINNGLNEVFSTLKKEKAQGAVGSELQSMLNSIQINHSLEKEWENFDRYFGNVHREFIARMSDAFPFLTITEKRLAALLKMNLTTKEIATILNIEARSVSVSKHRLKKRLGLTNDQDVHDFLVNFARSIDNSKITAG